MTEDIAQYHRSRPLRPAPETGIALRRTLTGRVIHAWFHMSQSTRRILAEQPGEGYLLFLVLMSDLAFFLSWTMKAVIVPDRGGVGLISTEIGILLVVALLARTVGLYFLAMLLGAVARLAGGRGSWRDTRIAVFWGVFITAPFGVFAALLSVLFTNLAIYYPIFDAPWISQPPYYLGMLPFVWYVSVALARAHGFRKTSPIFLIMSVVSLVAVILGMYFHARGLF